MPRFQIVFPYACISTVQQGFVATQHGGYLLHSRQKGDSFVDKTFGEITFRRNFNSADPGCFAMPVWYSMGIVLMLCQQYRHNAVMHSHDTQIIWAGMQAMLWVFVNTLSHQPLYIDAPRFVPQLPDRRKRSTMDAFHIRVLLVADQSVRQHHNSRDDAEDYLLAIMNIVSDMVEIVWLVYAHLYSIKGSSLSRNCMYGTNCESVCANEL